MSRLPYSQPLSVETGTPRCLAVSSSVQHAAAIQLRRLRLTLS